MTIPKEPTTDTDSSQRDEEDAVLKVGHAGILHQRYPFLSEEDPSFNDENAYVLSLEKEYLDIPQHLEYNSLEESIPEKHQLRLKAIWKLVERNYYEFQEICEDLVKKWTKGVPTDQLDDASGQIVDNSSIRILDKFKNGVRSLVTDASDKRELRTWQREEKALRKSLYETTKKYILLLRLYYEMLLESSPVKSEEKEYVLPKDHPARNEIVERNRYLRFIDAAHQGIAIGKAAHHEQQDGRLRKTEKIPYIVHGMDVTHATSLDVIPYTLDKGMANLAVIIALVGPIHDVIEDTHLSMEDLFGEQGHLRRLVDFCDTSIDPLIKSGFGETPESTRDQIKKRVLNLLKPEVFKIVQEVLRLLSNNIEWRPNEKVKATQQSIGGKELTMKILNIQPGQYKGWKNNIESRKTKTFTEFPEETDEKDHKSIAFLMRLNAMHGAESRQIALILKLEDRSNNILTLGNTAPNKKRRILRSTTSRIIAWAMLDHDNTKYPLYNALPRAIDMAIIGYEKLLASNPEVIEDLDHQYLARLKEWQTTAMRFTVPAKVQAVLEKNRSLQANTQPT